MSLKSNTSSLSSAEAMALIAKRYLSSHAGGTYTYRRYSTDGVTRKKDYRYHAELEQLIPKAPLNSYTYLWGVYTAEKAIVQPFVLTPFGPTEVYLNGELVIKSDFVTERFRQQTKTALSLKKGSNDLVIMCENTSGGFGCIFGPWAARHAYYFTKPFGLDEEGFSISEPLSTPLTTIDDTSLKSLTWDRLENEHASESINLQEVYPNANPTAWALVTTFLSLQEKTRCTISSSAKTYIDGSLVTSSIDLEAGIHEVRIHTPLLQELQILIKNEITDNTLPLINPVLTDVNPPYLLAGPFEIEPQLFEVQYLKPFDTLEGRSFWRLPGKNTHLRLYNDNTLFGHWNYPLGVTLYGLVESARLLNEEVGAQIDEYLVDHLSWSISTYEYAFWDEATFGGATAVHHLLTNLDSLDDCGSFGSTLLEIAKDHTLPNFDSIIDQVEKYISSGQCRLEDGTFYRAYMAHTFQEDTLWIDDLYMSIPFLVRQYARTKNEALLEDAIHQVFGISNYLYLEEDQIYGHVYDFKRSIANGIPWGRGNGWALFTLTELLMVLDKNHPKHASILALFRTLSEGYLRLQGPNGMYHQILTRKDSYEESSCTAMFACGFARGVRYGWYENPEPYRKASLQAIEALKQNAIDSDGHVWGVCRGSEFSCSPRYYMEQLLPLLDDTHGIGIILLALGENLKMEQSQSTM